MRTPDINPGFLVGVCNVHFLIFFCFVTCFLFLQSFLVVVCTFNVVLGVLVMVFNATFNNITAIS